MALNYSQDSRDLSVGKTSVQQAMEWLVLSVAAVNAITEFVEVFLQVFLGEPR